MKKCRCQIIRMLRILALVLPLLTLIIWSAPALAAPEISLSATIGAIGTKVTVDGTNFESYKGDTVFIYFDSTEIAGGALIVPQEGNFSIDFDIPGDAVPGRHRIKIKSETGATLVESLFIIPGTEIELDMVEGTVGAMVKIDGRGFYAGKMVTFYYFNRIREKLGTEIATATGEFSYRFTIPDSTAGKHKITAGNAEGDSAEAEFEVIPFITLNLTSGAIGDILTVGGNGFAYRSDVGIYFRNDEVAYAKTDEYGNFEGNFNVPEIRPDTYDIKAIDEDGNVDRVRFTITAGASLSQSAGSVGTELTVKGSGFKAGGIVVIGYDAAQVATATTDNNGAFSVSFDVPISTGGKHLVTVSDGTATRQLTFVVESTVPSIPALLLPANSSETLPAAYLDWGDIFDPSQPIVYSFQVASDRNFASIVLEKSGLTDSEYTLTEEEKLAAVKPESPYYWRVKAVDSAANESEWSSPRSFYIAAPPLPQLLLPETDSKTEAQASFDWEDVTSLSSPVTYRLQVAPDLNFASIVLEKKDLTASEYVLTEEEELAAVKQEAPYYWRVKAVDSAANESEWSSPRSFYVGFSFTLPGWIMYTLIGLGVILVGFIAFWLGRKTAYYYQSEL